MQTFILRDNKRRVPNGFDFPTVGFLLRLIRFEVVSARFSQTVIPVLEAIPHRRCQYKFSMPTTHRIEEAWLHLDSQLLRGGWPWCLESTTRPEPERHRVFSAWILWLVKALGGVARLRCCASKGSGFIPVAMGCCCLEKLSVDCTAYIIPLIQSERGNSFPRKVHYHHATTTA